jgi:hypothetical protein
MGHDLDDMAFACFLQLSMPPEWNYVFARLVDPYTTKDVEARIKGESSNRTAQSSATTSNSSALHTATMWNQTPWSSANPNPSSAPQNNWPSHGGNNNSNWQNQNYQSQDGCSDNCYDNRSNQWERQNQGPHRNFTPWCPNRQYQWNYAHIADNKQYQPSKQQPLEDQYQNDKYYSDISMMATSHTSLKFGWLRDSGATYYICHDRSAFATYRAHSATIVGIQSNVSPLTILGLGDIHL